MAINTGVGNYVSLTRTSRLHDHLRDAEEGIHADGWGIPNRLFAVRATSQTDCELDYWMMVPGAPVDFLRTLAGLRLRAESHVCAMALTIGDGATCSGLHPVVTPQCRRREPRRRALLAVLRDGRVVVACRREGHPMAVIPAVPHSLADHDALVHELRRILGSSSPE